MDCTNLLIGARKTILVSSITIIREGRIRRADPILPERARSENISLCLLKTRERMETENFTHDLTECIGGSEIYGECGPISVEEPIINCTNVVLSQT